MTKNQLTIEQAIAQGYSFCANLKDEIFTNLSTLTNEKLKEMQKNGDVFLVEKEVCSNGFPDANDVIEFIADDVTEHCSDVAEYEDIVTSLNKYKYNLQEVLGDMEHSIIVDKSTRTYELTQIKIITN